MHKKKKLLEKPFEMFLNWMQWCWGVLKMCVFFCFSCLSYEVCFVPNLG